VLNAGWLQRFKVDHWSRESALLTLGRPALAERVARWDGDIWTYWFQDSTSSRQVHLHLDRAGAVRHVVFTDESMHDDVLNFTHRASSCSPTHFSHENCFRRYAGICSRGAGAAACRRP